MSFINRSSIVLLGILLFIVIQYQYNLCECKKRISYSSVDINKNINLEEVFIELDSLTKNRIRDEWSQFKTTVDTFSIISQFRKRNRQVNIFEHLTDDQKHYGAVIFPDSFDVQKKYPLICWAEGLNQADPSVNINTKTLQALITRAPDHFFIIPSFRGQALVTDQKRYCSDGFFGDAFDGAADDAMRFLGLVKSRYGAVDKSKISVIGVSRGGTVALLMAARDSTISCVVSISGPTDFYSREAYERYGKQYKYQFLSTTTSIDHIRRKMIRSSPIYFIDNYPNSILLIHGKYDKVVDVSHAEAMKTILEEKPNFRFLLQEIGHEFYDWDTVIDFVKESE